MNRHKLLVMGTVLGLLLMLGLTLTAAAAPSGAPIRVKGTYEFYYDEPTVVMPLGRFCYIEVAGRYPFSGDLEGEALFDFEVISHGPCATALPFAYREDITGRGTFTGTVDGKEGTLALDYKGRAWPAEPGQRAVRSQMSILSGTEELAGAEGKLWVCYIMGETFDTYLGRIKFK